VVEASMAPLDYKLRLLGERLTPQDEAYWDEAAAILATAPSQAEMDRRILEIAPKYPWQREPGKQMATLRRMVLAARKHLGLRPDERRQSQSHSVRLSTKDLSSAEIILLRAFLSEEFRARAWRFACSPELFETVLGERISTAIRETFPEAAPEGRSADWLHRIEPEELRQAISDLTSDFRAENLGEQSLIDSISRMKDSRDRREFENFKQNGASPYEAFLKLKEKKVDSRPPKSDDGSLF